MPLVWTYMYTTAQSEDLDPDFQASDFKAPMAGFGYGLPLARLVSGRRRGEKGGADDDCVPIQYARYFGGDLKLISMEGFGCDAYLHLNVSVVTTERSPRSNMHADPCPPSG